MRERERYSLKAVDGVAAAVIFATAVLVFAGSVRYGFVWDDLPVLTALPALDGFGSVKRFFTITLFDLYRPLGMMFVAVCRDAFGASPAPYHALNVGLNGACCVMLYFLLHALFGDRRLAFVSAMLFCVHTIHAMTVSYVSCVLDLLSALMLFVMMLCFVIEDGGAARRRAGAAAGTLIYGAALLVKEVAIVFPALVVLADVFTGRRTFVKSVVARLHLFAMSAVYVGARFFAAGVVQQGALLRGQSKAVVVASSIKLVPHYLFDLTYPKMLCPDFVSFKLAGSFAEPAVWGTLLGCAAFAVLLPFLARRARVAAFGGCWFFVTLLPFMNIVPLATFCADRFMYIPSAGYVVAAVWVMIKVSERVARGGVAGTAALVLLAVCAGVVWGGGTLRQNEVWRDEGVLYGEMCRCAPKSFYARNKLGIYYMSVGRPADAERVFQDGLDRAPDNTVIIKNLAVAAAALGNNDKAAKLFERALKIDPSDVQARNSLMRLRGGAGK